jgi:SpoVK/Ycf46/Vps4 family AAA+-type ATPase
MPSGKLLRQLIKTGAEGNLDAFKRVSEELIKEERAKQHHLLANDLERILYGRNQALSGQTRVIVDRVPEDRERGMRLLEVREPVRTLEDLILSDENSSLLEEILQEHHRVEVLRSYGLYPADRLLFCGPPGCGKTLTAEVTAGELGLPLALVRTDSVVSSYLGETAANLRKVFDFISSLPMVVLFDEFDALGKERADSAEHGELKRVVNAFLQMMDAYEGKSLLIAATNHEGILDSAVWRRFDEVLVFEPPNLEQLRRLLAVKLRGIRREFETDDTKILSLFKGMSHADVERVLRRAIKDMILSGKEFLTLRHIEVAERREEARRSRITRK